MEFYCWRICLFSSNVTFSHSRNLINLKLNLVSDYVHSNLVRNNLVITCMLSLNVNTNIEQDRIRGFGSQKLISRQKT